MFTPKELALERGWPGRIDGDRVIQLAAQTLQSFFTGGGSAREHAEYALADIDFRPPVLRPPSVRDFMAFEEHVANARRQRGSEVPKEWYEMPVFYFSNPHAIYGDGEAVPYPEGTQELDYELECAVVIGAEGKIGGFTVMNDWSARDVQGREMRLGLGPSKGKDFATTIGPWVVTADELDDCRDADGFLDLPMTVSVNGVRIGQDRSGHMGWSFEQLVSHASRASWVKAGEVLASGTCSTGSLAESWGRTGSMVPPPLQVGDVVEMTIERLGTIRNSVAPREESVAPVAPARRRTRLEASA